MQTLFAVFLTGVAGILTYLLKNEVEKRREAERSVSEKRFKVYTDLVKAIFKYYDHATEGKDDPRHARDFVKSLKDARTDLLLLGSDDVYVAFKELLKQSFRDSDEVEVTFFRVYDLVIKIRRDIGYSKTKLTPLDPLEATVNDLETSEEGQKMKVKLETLIKEYGY